jgi:predicted transcriptional regulator
MLPLVGCHFFYLGLVLHTKNSMMRKKSNISIKLGDKVRELRMSKSLSQEQLAHIANVHRTYIGMVERAEKNITLVNIEKIAIALEVNIIDLLK